MAQGLDNFLYDVTVDGKTGNFHFWDADDATNVADVSVSDSDFEGNLVGREAAEFAYSKVSKQMNDKRTERLAGAEAARVKAQSDQDKADKAATADYLQTAVDNSTQSIGTEKREDGVTQNVYSSTLTDKGSDKSDKKK